MDSLSDLLLALSEGIPADRDDSGMRLRVERYEVEAPIETVSWGRELRMSLPRGRFQTGFRMPHGRLRVRFERGAP
jgi:hypothetical protein